ncbi:HD domain-containing protein [Luteibacter aegosomaticola]|uniref:HD domain-containing protein n=1 Tax=Luteibacter aegosomaticola TaxID=2911538 RepID=UPI001FF9ED51|nr:HD domain-containing protein [Luteibacter aegosomaticola]UPG88072.1 HD domain-containing protein [Luteibacter aegosomaticola]
MNVPITLAGITAPDSAHTRKAADLVARVHNREMLNHVHRSWWFAEFLGRKRGLKYDREVVYLAAIMHDLGLTEAYAADKRFEVDGADAARGILLADGYAETRAQTVWDAIALHSSIGIAGYKEPEIALVHMGSHLDVLGFHYDELTPQVIDDTLQLYPRVGFPAAFQAALAEVVRKKPMLAAGTGLVDIGHRHVPGFTLPNGCDLLENTVFETRHVHA